MNQISDATLIKANDMSCKGYSIRDIANKCGISRETAHRIQMAGYVIDLKVEGVAIIGKGLNKHGEPVFYCTREHRDYWPTMDDYMVKRMLALKR